MSYALVTGSAKGIGRAIAEELAARNYHLLLVDIDESGLSKTAEHIEATYQKNVHTLPLDLSKPGAVQQIRSWTEQYHKELTIVINNAGYGLNGPFEAIGLEEQLNMIDVNIRAQVSISHTYIPVLKNHPASYLLNVSSTTAYQSVPYLNIYAASKVFILSFTRSLRYELRESPVSVSCLIPGSTDTDFVVRAGMEASTLKTAERFNMTPQKVGRIAVAGLFKGKSEIIPGFNNKLHAFLPKFFPKAFVERIAGNIYVPKEKYQAQYS